MNAFEMAKQCFVAGLQLLEAKDLEGAEAQFTRSLELLPARVSTLNNLAAIKNSLNKFAEAEAFARQVLAIEGKSPEAWTNLGIALGKTGRHEEALAAYAQALDCDPAYGKARVNQAVTLLELKRHEEALLACDDALKLDPQQHELVHNKSLALKELGRPEEARTTYLAGLAMRVVASPGYIAQRRATQKADALIISPDPYFDESLKSFDTLHRECPNYPRQLAQRLQSDFHFTFVFKGDAASASARQQLPQPDFVINNCVNAEVVLSEGNVPGLIELVDSFGVPVVNHPSKVVRNTRDETARLLQDTPGVVVPKTVRFSAQGKTPEELAQEIEAEFEYPLITRSLAAQKGVGMNKVDSRKELIATLAASKMQGLFVTQFVETRSSDELFRKLRASIVDDEIVIVRADFHPEWKVHGGRSGRRLSFYLENPQLLELEKRICADPEKEFGRSAMQSLRAVRDRIPLDIFGIDFNFDANGSLVFYEANATMNLLSTARSEVANPKEADDRLQQAFRRYLASLANCRLGDERASSDATRANPV
jgi:tetratricopeptide (TPR) repeat protein